MVLYLPPQVPDPIFEEWNLRMLPYYYEITTVGNILRIVIESFPKKRIVRNGDRSIMRMSNTGQPIINRDFQYSYYHFKRDYIARKNPAFAQNPAMFATTDV